MEPNPEETALYEALRTEAVEQLSSKDLNPNQQRFQVLASITKLRRAVCNPNMIIKGANLPSAKLEAFAEILDELLENKHKSTGVQPVCRTPVTHSRLPGPARYRLPVPGRLNAGKKT